MFAVATKCQKCGQHRILVGQFQGHKILGIFKENELPEYQPSLSEPIDLHLCLDCGQIQGIWPISGHED